MNNCGFIVKARKGPEDLALNFQIIQYDVLG